MSCVRLRVFKVKVRVCSPGSRPITVKVTLPTPPADSLLQLLQVVECWPSCPATGWDFSRQSAGPAFSVRQY